MRARHVFAAAVIAAWATTAVLACNLLNGASDLTTSDDSTDDEGRMRGNDGDGGSPTAEGAAPPTCACVAPPPSGWAGPIALLENSGAARACPTGLSTKFEGGVDASGSSCSACSCGAPKDACSSVYLETSGMSLVCSNPCNSLRTIDAGCGTVRYCFTTGSVIVNPALDAGSCTPSGGKPKPATWAKSAVACDFTVPIEDTCGSGRVCAPKSEGATDARTCILHAGDMTCPPGPYATRVVYDSQLVDTRTCGPCACDPPQGTCTTGTITFYGDNACTNIAKAVPTNGDCTQISASDANGSAKLTTIPTLIDGGCAPHGGALQDGGVTGTSPSTICCL